ncbi:uncharacterized protein LOC128157363 isoform X2 [Crassostrea angulata]|uniref:uncharacterized protein LOC128157363 isoform X2 n=1 Tax=Magallana angulata TaxID=2784310 RepID=UPI0022B199A3|nr:uncharacterized protein LOC128157363 isoform X2 [Crassostrea angulata]
MKTFDVTWFAAIVLLHTGPVLPQLFNLQNSGQGLSPNGRLDISQFILPVVILLILASLPLLVGSSWIFLRDMDDEDNNENKQPDYTTETSITEGRIPRITNSPSGDKVTEEPVDPTPA